MNVEHVIYKQDDQRIHKALAFDRKMVEGKEVVTLVYVAPELEQLLMTGHGEDALKLVRDVSVEQVFDAFEVMLASVQLANKVAEVISISPPQQLFEPVDATGDAA